MRRPTCAYCRQGRGSKPKSSLLLLKPLEKFVTNAKECYNLGVQTQPGVILYAMRHEYKA